MYNFKFADIGEGIHEGQILKWLKNEGDAVEEGETLVIVETDKVNAEIPSPVSGTLIKHGAKVGETILVGNTLAVIDDGSGGEAETSVDEKPAKVDRTDEEKASVIGEIEVSDEVIETSQEVRTETETARTLATPVARMLARDLGIDIDTVQGSGEHGRVLKEDLLKLKSESSVLVPKAVAPVLSISGDVTRVPISKTRKAIVNAMTISKANIPHTVLMDEVNISALVEFRKNTKELAEKKGIKLTYMAFIMKATLLAIKEYPIFNSSYDEAAEEIVYKNFINLGIAVDTPEGLIVPNIKNAAQMSIFELASELKALAEAATNRTLKLDQIQNGTFTITNYGALDSLFGTPIIKHPEVAILGIGKIHKKPVVIDDEIKIADILPLSIAVDHRIIDGADAGRFLIRVKEYLQNPTLLLLS
ncbi:MAG TPA: 2-oxo acid dehydrogenase subunit E2 [Acholeplasmataceae bacterium]|jgi:pyruvate dehydrogenase E2 component (dihydrolipoamide acetyltransferase)|nr:2-oxo acid dehydrogenase subunit E2 [Acholeplasmataceae bacterium]